MNSIKQYLSAILRTYLLFVAIIFVFRALLYGIYFDRLNDISIGHSLLAFIYGLRMDTIAVSIVLIIPAIVLAVTPKSLSKIGAKFLKYYFLAWLLIFVFIENATIPFFAQYDVRPNYLFVEYLEYPDEVASLMIKDYKLSLFVALLMMISIGYLFLKSKISDFTDAFEARYLVRIAMLLPILVILFIGIRSSFGHRPANVSDAMYSQNRIINEIAKNSIHSIGYAYYSTKKNSDKLIEKYGKMEIEKAYELTSKMLNIPNTNHSFNRNVQTHFKLQKPKNIVIFIQESMGAQFVEFSGGEKNLTPNMNSLGNQYLAFTNLYSNGTRSIRGLSGLSAGFLPIAGEGVVKRNKSQNDFFTVASLLKKFGYKSSFIYGGEARFDNMRSWFLGNGFDEVIEQKDYQNPTFVSTWGVSDEDLVIKANEKFKSHHAKGDKFASVMFSSSNHAPFELPDGKISFEPNEPKNSVKNAIKYADFAIGRFFELAKKEPYFKDTVFVVAADHNVRVYGDDIVPVNMFQIPAIIVADHIKAQKYEKLATQPDVLATALDLIGIDLAYPIFGHSIFSDQKTDVVLMQFNDTYGLRKGDKIAVIGPNIQPQTFEYKNKKLSKIDHDKNLEDSALAILIVLNDQYNKKLFTTSK